MKIADHVIEEYDEESGKFILIDVEEGRLFNLNANAHKIICSVRQYGDLTGYYKQMKNNEVSQTVIEQDAALFLNMLREKGYIIV